VSISSQGCVLIGGNLPNASSTLNAGSPLLDVVATRACASGIAGVAIGGIGIEGLSAFSPGVAGFTRGPSGVAAVCGIALCTNESSGSLALGPGIGVRGRAFSGLGVQGASCVSSGVGGTTRGNACTAAVCGHALSPCFRVTACGPGIGVRGSSGSGPGILGQSVLGPGLSALSCVSTISTFGNSGKGADKSALVEFRPGGGGCIAAGSWLEGASGQGNVFGIPRGSFYAGFKAPGSTGPDPKHRPFVISCSGRVGVGVNAPATCLQVGGSISLKAITVNATGTVQSYGMQTSCFAIFADAKSLPPHIKTFKITLVPAATAPGMMVSIKKIDGSDNSVTVSADTKAGDKVEGGPDYVLTDRFSAVNLIADGRHDWLIVSRQGAGRGRGAD